MCVPCEELLTTEHILLINFCSDFIETREQYVFTLGIFFKEISLDYIFEFLKEMVFWWFCFYSFVTLFLNWQCIRFNKYIFFSTNSVWITKCVLAWFNSPGWLGIKNQVTYHLLQWNWARIHQDGSHLSHELSCQHNLRSREDSKQPKTMGTGTRTAICLRAAQKHTVEPTNYLIWFFSPIQPAHRCISSTTWSHPVPDTRREEASYCL